jgi:hypothetical protein
MFYYQVVPVTIFSADGGTCRTTENIKYHYSGDVHYPVVKSGERFQIFEGSPRSIIEVTDAYLVPGAMCLYDRSGVRIAESCIRRGQGLTEFLYAGADAISLPSDFTTIDEPLVYLAWISNHWGDFLTEGTSRIWALLQYPELAAIAGFYLSGSAVHGNIVDFIRALNLNIRVGAYDTNRCIRFRKIFIPKASFSNRGEAYSVHRLSRADCQHGHRYGLLYSDEDRIEEDEFGRCVHHTPFFKPGFDPDLLLALNYICHLVVLRRDVIAPLPHERPRLADELPGTLRNFACRQCFPGS